MPIIINKKKFTGQITPSLYKEMYHEISQLPKPKIIPLDQSDADATNTVLCLEREIAYLKKDSALHVKYIGSKHIISCMVVYIYSQTDHLIIHVDRLDLSHSDNLNRILDIIQGFDDKNNINVALVGGVLHQKSEINLINILTLFSNLSIKSNLDFNIEMQAINIHNLFVEQDRYEYVYNSIIEKIDILSREYFNHPFDINLIKDKKISDLINMHQLNDVNFASFATLAILSQEVCQKSTRTCIDLLQNNIKAQDFIKNENDFIQMAKKLFSIEGFEPFDLYYRTNNIYPEVKLINIVFDTSTREISIIKRCHPTPNEILRNAYLLDFYNEKPIYLLCFDKSTDLIPPLLTDEFVQFCLTLENDVRQGITKDEGQLFPKRFPYKDASYIRNGLFRFIKLQINNKSQKDALQKSSSFFEKTNPVTLYKQAVDEYKKGNYTLAGYLFEQALQGFKNKGNSIIQQGLCHYSLASLHYKSSNLKQAILHCEDAIMLFYSRNDQKNLNDAEKRYQNYLLESKISPEDIYQNAVNLFKENNYYIALKKLLFVLDQFDEDKQPKKSATTHSTIASCYRDLGNIELAIEHCDLALKILNTHNINEGKDIEEKRNNMMEQKKEIINKY